MRMCPECREGYEDDVPVCPAHGAALVSPDFFPTDDTLEPGTMVGEYRIDRKIGGGTFGDVYAGEHPLIGKKVAVKVLNRRFASDPEAVSRFIAEARAVNKIRHRNIIDIFSFNTLPGGRHYFVMEYVEGQTLAALIQQKRRLPIPTALQIAQGVASALDAAHEAGITHRDLKPENVFLAAERDGSHFPKLLDFGIAKLMDDDVAHKTGSGVLLGTPLYMSPEQARGKKVDARSDIYSLGVMIHEMLTGVVPFAGDSAMDVVLKHDTEPPPAMASVCPDLPPALDAPVLAMLEKRPRNRPASAGEAVAALVAQAALLELVPRPPLPSSVESARAPLESEGLRATAQAGRSAPAETPHARSEPSSTERMSALDSSSVNRKNGPSARWLFAALGIAAIGGTASLMARSPAPSDEPFGPGASSGMQVESPEPERIPTAAPSPAPPEISPAPAPTTTTSASVAPQPRPAKPAKTKPPSKTPNLDPILGERE
ncbi:serine/threonine-protein kinase [Polyangium jinanense]|uniref:non-specific serine/threonine protein kinase n=1 Tax=Polyangium jinanense TaxID=2829994 RepID=A0A9X3X9B5_9BACT|nr:serine/threonine-protein kinase [Polyangium jinanense]MDC3961647.1 protein kinase [Polyangium jinanense]MDC3983746.1 protein kinase [Polyangium jinanense]